MCILALMALLSVINIKGRGWSMWKYNFSCDLWQVEIVACSEMAIAFIGALNAFCLCGTVL